MTRDRPARTRREVLQGGLALAGLGLLAGCGPPIPWQRPAKVPRIGYLGLARTPNEEGLRQELRELGYVEGENIVVEWRWADDQEERLPQLAEELLRLDLDLLVVFGTAASRAAKRATSTVPVVFSVVTDPVGEGLVTNLARPEGNLTGTSNSVRGLHGKRLQLLAEAVPAASRIVALSYWSVTTNPSRTTALTWQETQEAAQKLGVRVQVYDAPGSADLDGTFATIQRDQADAFLLLPSGPVYFGQRARIAQLAARAGLPSMYEARGYAEAGGLLAYGVDVFELSRRAATYVDKILKGARPADLPVEQPTKFDFAINLSTARDLGLTIPQSLLQQATEVIQ
jgi:putative ABC transport system substrate-binding protein